MLERGSIMVDDDSSFSKRLKGITRDQMDAYFSGQDVMITLLALWASFISRAKELNLKEWPFLGVWLLLEWPFALGALLFLN